MTDPIEIVVADSAPIYRNAFKIAANRLQVEVVFVEISDWYQLEHYVRTAKAVGLLVVDSALSGLESISQLFALKKLCHSPLVVTTQNASPKFVRTIQAAGASAIVCKSLPVQQFTVALQEVLSGREFFPDADDSTDAHHHHVTHPEHAFKYLSKAELEIVGRVRKGWQNRQIAEQLKLAESTVKTHLHNTYRKLEVDNRTQLVSLALRWPHVYDAS
ncbi:MAG: response regulator transcription factor [Motiliproteus sp.]